MYVKIHVFVLLLARYVPYRSEDECSVSIDDRPGPTDLSFWKNRVFATGHPIHFMFGSRMRFTGSAVEGRYFGAEQIQ